MRGSFRRGNVTRIGGFLKSTLQDLGVQEKVLQQQALAKWKEAVGPQIAASTRPETVRDGVLFVCCKSSMWSNELSLHKDDIVEKLNKAVGKRVITDIRFSARGFRKETDQPVPAFKTPTLESIALDPEQSEIAEKTAAVCASDELAARVKNAILTSKRLREAKLREGYRPCGRCNELHNGKHELCESCRTAQ